ncbi:MAG: ribosomal protein S18-alanine N-acetyltransferase [Bacilli bacterium]|nr:ribosomal protein S18-alanine N-acetyltransferase [Bacilli bacterium]
MVEVRDLVLEDLESVMEIENTSFIAPWKKEELLYELNDNEFAFLSVILYNNKVVGFLDYWVTFDSATIAQIAIHPNYRKNKLGSILLEEMIKDAKAKKVRNITLEVRKNNEKAVNLYLKYGFKTELVKEKYYSNGDDALYMIKELN